MSTLMAFDTSYLYFRAFFGVPSTFRALDGRPVNAVRGTLDFISRLVGQYRPDALVCAWDDDWRPAWRVDLLPSYKAHRVVEVADTGDRQGDIASGVQAITTFVEARVREHPVDWFWVHKRWPDKVYRALSSGPGR